MEQGLKRGNMLWESSRMFLPEHKEALLAYNHEKMKKARRELDEQEKQIIVLAIRDSMVNKMPVTFHMFDPFDDLQVVGYVERVDSYKRQIRVNGDWYSMDDISSVEVTEDYC